jgi:hypothetical protein
MVLGKRLYVHICRKSPFLLLSLCLFFLLFFLVIFRLVPFSQVAASLSPPLVPKGGPGVGVVAVFKGDVPCDDASLDLSIEGRVLLYPYLEC